MQEHPSLRFIVQDQAKMLALADKSKLIGLEAQITLEPWDYFTTQLVRDVDVFLLRRVLHQNSDVDCIRILRTFVPAMAARSHTALFIADVVLPEIGADISKPEERRLRQRDIGMLIMHGTQERTISELRKLLTAADDRLEASLCPPNLIDNNPIADCGGKQIAKVWQEGMEGIIEVRLLSA